MSKNVVFVERRDNEFVSLEKAFRQIAAHLTDRYSHRFEKVPYGNRIWDTARNLIFFRRPEADIFHITGHIHYIAMLLPRSNTVLSIMDVRFVHLPPSFRRTVMKKLYLDLPVRRLNYITAISEQTKKEIVEYSGCDASKVHVLPLPLLEHIYIETERPFDASCPVILQIGTMDNKNIPNLAKALSGIDCVLRVIGRLNDSQVDVLKDNNIQYQNAWGLSDEELRLEYENCDIVAFCSTYEGFGLPIIEGQAMKKPVITSDLSPMKETSGGAAILIDPHDPASIRSGIERLISDQGLRERLIHEGQANARRFEPSAVAREYEKLYDRILKNAEP